MLRAGNAQVTSAKGTIAVIAGPATVSGTFSESIAAGKVTGIDLSMFLKASGHDITIRMIILNQKLYLGGNTLLSALGAGNKSWALVSKSSKNPQLSKLGDQLDTYLDTASAGQYQAYATAASSVVDGGDQRWGAGTAHKYTVNVDVAALAKLTTGPSAQSMQALASSGVRSLPTTIWLDRFHRVVEADTDVTASGVTSHTVFKVTSYNSAVVIKAPPAADVYTG